MAKELPEQSTGNGSSSDKTRNLYNKCKAEEARITPDKWKKVQELFVREMTFRPPLIVSHPPEKKYKDVLELFRNAQNWDKVVWVLANWLKCEGVRTPDQLLPEDEYRRVTARPRRKFNRMSWTDFYYADLVGLWRPYSEVLLRDIKSRRGLRPDKLDRELRALGYDAGSVALAMKKTWLSGLAFTCEWLAERGVVRSTKKRKNPDPARTLRNAYTRICGSGAPRLIKCAFCEELAVSEFNAQDSTSAAHCEQHASEWMPTSPDKPWLDKLGRRWWRSGASFHYLAAESESSS